MPPEGFLGRVSRDMPSHYAILCNAAGGAAEFLSIYVHKVVGWAAVTQLKNARNLGRAPTRRCAMWDVGRSSTFPDLYGNLTTWPDLSLSHSGRCVALRTKRRCQRKDEMDTSRRRHRPNLRLRGAIPIVSRGIVSRGPT